MHQRRILKYDDSVNPDVFIYQHGSIYDMQKGMNNPSSIVLGIDDVEQRVEPLHSFLYKTSQNLFDPHITIKKINDASSFLVFGCSFGNSDANYFKAVFNPQNVGKSYIIYYYGDDNLLIIKSNLRKFCGDFFNFIAANRMILLDIKDINIRQKTREAIDSILNEDSDAISK